MIKGIDHIELIVRDFEEYVEFLENLGFELLVRTDHHGASAELKPPGENQPIFEIHQATGEEVIGVNHIAFAVDDIEAADAALKEKGIATGGGPGYVEATGRTNINLRDPDGWRLQLVHAKRDMPPG
ncbi:MAG: VOC family protein [Alphaproteobacteria bacterium]|jgi:catechol 2,3-dioxygenase-like lactoylglutathione lyase family enzyme|nr:VOC family protein [Alphaproteobacteria bacterium]